MTTYTEPPEMFNGDWVTPAWLNTNLRANFQALAPYISTGQLGYWNNTLKKIVPIIGTAGQNLVMTGGLPVFDEPDVIHTFGNLTYYGSQSTSSGTPVDVTGMSLNLTLSRACKIIVTGSVVGLTSNASYYVAYNLSVNGVAVGDFRSYSPYGSPIGIGAIASGVAAGTRNVKLQFSSPYEVSVTSFGGFLAVMAVPN